MPALTKEQIIARLSAHRPVGEDQAARGVTVRWLATGALVFLLPLGVFLLRSQHPFLADHAWQMALALTALGLLGVFVGYMAATRRQAAERQWGLAALSKQECVELEEVSAQVPEIARIVDHWLEMWVSAGKSPRGRELALVREMVTAWHRAEGNVGRTGAASEHTSSPA